MNPQNSSDDQNRKTPEIGHRISTSAARRMLGMIGKNYDDDDVAEILDILYGIAEEGFEIYSNATERTEPGE